MTAALLFQVAAKVTIVLATTWGLTRVMARCSAASRHLVWVLAIVAALAVPVVDLFGPAWTLAVLPSAGVAAPAADLAAAAPIEEVATALPDPPERESGTPADAAGFRTGSVSGPTPFTEAAAPAPLPFDWPAALVRVWLAGALLLLLRLAAGLAWAGWIAARAAPVTDGAWLDSLEDSIAALGVTARVSLKTSARTTIPMAAGLWKPVILLPRGAEDWSAERRQVVLQHELAHVKRRDCLVQAIAQVACALHWFNPAAHVAVSGLRTEQERACDDLVIEAGTDPRTYADNLFEIARAYRATTVPAFATLAMARPSQLEGRMVAILDSRRSRRPPSFWVRVAAALIVAAAILPFGALHLSAQTSPVSEAVVMAVEQDIPDVAPGLAVEADIVAAGEPVAFGDAAPADQTRPFEIGFPAVVEDSFASLADAIPSMGFDRKDLFAAIPSFLRSGADADAGAAESKTATASATRSNRRTDDGPLQQSQAQGTPVTDDTRRRVADALIIALGDENADVREEALSALAEMRDERAIPGLIKALGDPSADVRSRALDTLVQFNTQAAADGVITALKDGNADVRERAARHLGAIMSRGQFRDPKYVDVFSALLKDANADVREQAVVALGRLRVASAEGPLTQALKDSAPDVRQQAARALGQLRSTDAVPAIIALLKDPAKDVRVQAANALGSIADPRAIDPLTAALKDADPEVREQAARALGQIARGQRRNGLPVPVPPLPPRPPQARLDIDVQRLQEMAEERAQEAMERAERDIERAQRDAERTQRDVERRMRDFDGRLGDFDFFLVPPPAPAPSPRPNASPTPAPPPPPGRP